MIGGFIVGATTESGPSRLIIRALGPSLPLSGTLQDPTLELHDSNGATIASNDNWKDTQESEIRFTTIPPTDDRESAIVKTLTRGAYTAIVRGKNNTVGIALVEVYKNKLIRWRDGRCRSINHGTTRRSSLQEYPDRVRNAQSQARATFALSFRPRKDKFTAMFPLWLFPKLSLAGRRNRRSDDAFAPVIMTSNSR